MAEESLCHSFTKRQANMSHQAFVNKQAHVTHFVEEVLDVVFHVFILFTALCALLQFIIGPILFLVSYEIGYEIAKRRQLKRSLQRAQMRCYGKSLFDIKP